MKILRQLFNKLQLLIMGIIMAAIVVILGLSAICFFPANLVRYSTFIEGTGNRELIGCFNN